MPTLHWFYSVGTSMQEANYALTADLAERVERLFPSAGARSTGTGGHSAVCRGEHGTRGLLGLLGPPSAGWVVQPWRVDTTETERIGLEPPLPRDGDLPWPSGSCLPVRRLVVIPDRGPVEIARVVGAVLGLDALSDGDAVFFEATSGLRPVQMALTLSAELLAVVRPGVAFLGASYAEFRPAGPPPGSPVPPGSPQAPAAGGISPIYDQSALLELPAYAVAVAGLRARLDAEQLADLLKPAPDLHAAMQRLTRHFDLGWPLDLPASVQAVEELIGEASSAAAGPARTAEEAARRVALDLVQTELRSLSAVMPDHSSNVVSLQTVRFFIEAARRLVRARRFGDAARVLRETLVIRMVVALGGGAPRLDRKSCARAEQALFFSTNKDVSSLWTELGSWRNRASHANLAEAGERKAVEELIAAIRGGSSGGAEPPPMADRVADCVNDPSMWTDVRSRSPGVDWVWGTGGPAPDLALRVEWTADRLEQRAQNRSRTGKSLKSPDRGGAAPPGVCWELCAKPDGVPGGDWFRERLEKAVAEKGGSGSLKHPRCTHLVLCGAEWAPVVPVLFARFALECGCLPWLYAGGAPLPLFDTKQYKLLRG